ncbi:MAG: Polysaccharide transporter, permease component [Capsulimonas sp.]|jgi:lipopolysaccharide transport system permease protein|nr:Polysaccharide transporter, permease component [Capsulimonas sp.]
MTTPSIIIKPLKLGEPGVIAEAREMWRYRSLIHTLVRRELKIRYRNSVLGLAWSMINPLVQVFVMTIALGLINGSISRDMSAYLLCAYLPWNFFQSAVLDSSTAVLGQIGLLKKVYFPREIPVIAVVCSNFIHFLLAMCVFVIYRWVLTPIFVGWPGPPPREVFYLPLVILVQFLLTLGVSFFVCAWNVFYEDVKFLVTMMMSFLFWLLPIMYFAENLRYSVKIPAHWQSLAYHLYLANPLAWVITAYKEVLLPPKIIANPGALVGKTALTAPFDIRYFAIALVTSSLLCLAGYVYFNRLKWKFTERP